MEDRYKNCCICGQKFLDQSRSKNKISCSPVCWAERDRINKQKSYIKKKELGIKDMYRDRRTYRKEKYRYDINFNISMKLRTRFGSALKSQKANKDSSSINYLGCTIDEFRVYLSSRFQSGMSWDNHGKDGWHIDHIIPISSFNLNNEEEIKKACHYTNLQPLWARDNHMKSDTINIVPQLNIQNPGTKTTPSTNVIYILGGVNGSGKSYIGNRLKDKFEIIDYDKHSLRECLELCKLPSDKKKLLITPIQVKRIVRELKQYDIECRCAYLREPKEVIVARIGLRGGNVTSTVDKRIKRYESLKDTVFHYYGSQVEVEQWLISCISK